MEGAWIYQSAVEIGSMVIAQCSNCNQYGVVVVYCMNCGSKNGENSDEEDCIKQVPTADRIHGRCQTCDAWNSDLKYCMRIAQFSDAEDFCSEYSERG